MMRTFVRRAAMILVPTLLVVCAFSTGGSQQQTSTNLFDPVYQIYQYLQSYFYKPELLNDQQALYGAEKGLVQQLGDPYSEFLDPTELKDFNDSLNGQFSGVGIEISIKNDVLTVIAPLAGTPGEAAGIVAGDQILAIDGKSTEGMTLSEAGVKIRGETGTTVVLTIRHADGTTLDISIVRADITIDSVQSKTLDDGKVGYIRILRFDSDTEGKLDQALGSFDLNSMTGLVLDLRNDPGGLMQEAIAVASRFVDEGIVLRTQDRLAGEKLYWSKGNRVPNLPLAVLINRGTASASEITAGAIRDNDMGILIGETSYGKGVFQQLIDLPDGSALKVTVGEYFTPAGRTVNNVGLAPDIAVPEDGDPLAVAVQWIEDHAGTLMPMDLGTPPTPAS